MPCGICGGASIRILTDIDIHLSSKVQAHCYLLCPLWCKSLEGIEIPTGLATVKKSPRCASLGALQLTAEWETSAVLSVLVALTTVYCKRLYCVDWIARDSIELIVLQRIDWIARDCIVLSSLD